MIRKPHIFLILFVLLAAWLPAAAQDGAPADGNPDHGRAVPVVREADANDTTPPLHTIRPNPPRAGELLELPRKWLPNRQETAGPFDADPLVQAEPGAAAMPAAIVNFDGVNNRDGVLPPDTNGDVGPNHYVQTVNLSFQIWNKAGVSVYGPANINTLWNGFGGVCQTTNNGDPIVLYDHLADRWMISQFALPNYPFGPFYQCIAVSQTPDPTGAWHRYQFTVSNTKMNDYPKFGVWPDGYYMTVNQFNQSSLSWGGAGVVVFERDKMLLGQTARMIYFDLWSVDQNLGGMLPSDLDGPVPPAGAPNPFIQLDDNAWGYPQDQLEIWNFHADWTNPPSSSFTKVNTLATASFDSNMCAGSRNCIPQPGTTVKLDAIADRMMYRLQYRNFGTYEAMVANHTVDANGADRAGVRWYELRKSGANWSINQQGTYSPDANNRWMASVAMDKTGNIGLGYSVSSGSIYPSIRYTGRLVTDPLGQLPQGESTLFAGSGSQTHSASRWGDYSSLMVDPVDDCTFWFTTEYLATTGSAPWRTRIGSFKFDTCGAPPPPSTPMHVGDLDGARAWLSGNRAWTATVTVLVHTDIDVPVGGAAVSGTWSGGISGSGTCTTGTGGTCSVTANNINKKKTSVTFTVNGVNKTGYSYLSTANHDPDGDSTGSTITVVRP